MNNYDISYNIHIINNVLDSLSVIIEPSRLFVGTTEQCDNLFINQLGV